MGSLSKGEWGQLKIKLQKRLKALHPSGCCAIAVDPNVAFELAQREIGEIQDIEEALHRMKTGEYGRCENCGKSISLARLKKDPESKYCSQCLGE